MMDYRLRLCFGLLLLLLSVLTHACSGSQPDNNAVASGSPAYAGPPAYEGFVADINCNTVRAWGWDMLRPNDPIKLDFYAGETLVGTATADVFGQDLLGAGKGNGKHYVGWSLPILLKDGKPHTIKVKFGGTPVELPLAVKGSSEITCNLDER